MWVSGTIKPFYKNKGDKISPKNLPFILFKSILYHKASRHTVSNAFSKSTKAQNNFFFLFFKISKKE
jgi:hypothetical protein